MRKFINKLNNKEKIMQPYSTTPGYYNPTGSSADYNYNSQPGYNPQPSYPQPVQPVNVQAQSTTNVINVAAPVIMQPAPVPVPVIVPPPAVVVVNNKPKEKSVAWKVAAAVGNFFTAVGLGIVAVLACIFVANSSNNNHHYRNHHRNHHHNNGGRTVNVTLQVNSHRRHH